MPSIEELRQRIKKLEALEPEPGSDEYNLLQRLKKELAAKVNPAATAAPTSVTEDIDFQITQEEWDQARSKFANQGLHLAEFGVPDWKTPGKSIELPFTIIAGPDKGLTSSIYVGVAGRGVGILKRFLTAMGITPTFPITLAKLKQWVPGKKAMVLWAPAVDRRPVEEGGTGRIYTKPIDVRPIGTPEPEVIEPVVE
jgi:hypothetical protein